jgi:hypothetical protein
MKGSVGRESRERGRKRERGGTNGGRKVVQDEGSSRDACAKTTTERQKGSAMRIGVVR